MLVVLPIAALGTYFLALKTRVPSWREAFLAGAVLWATVLVAITEVLSLLRALTPGGLATAWLVALAAGVGLALSGGTRRVRPAWWAHAVEWREMACILPLAALVGVLGAVAVRSPPNTWDSMTYHMARVMHWSQGASLSAYPTHIPRQLSLQPGAEFILLHLQILTGGDHLAGLVQWSSMVGVLIGTSCIARYLGAHRLGSLCATIFAASIPIGILESTSTQNDHVVAFWLVCAVVFALRIMRSRDRPLRWAITAAFGASLGLAMLTKATAYLVALPLLCWVMLGLVRRRSRQGFASLVFAGFIVFGLNSGFYARNVWVFGSPIGPTDEGAPSLHYMNAAFAPPLLASNLVRDVGVNFNATPFAAINVRALNFVRLVHRWLGVDIADPRTTWGEEVFREQPVGLAFDENDASNPVHVVLLVGALALIWPLRRALGVYVWGYALVLSAAFFLFVVVLRWQPWHTRLELPFFVLGAPLVGSVVERGAPRLGWVLLILLLVSMLPWVAYNQARPLVGPRSILSVSRTDQYFTNRPGLRTGYQAAVGYLRERGCARVGFLSTGDGWEYPLWPLLDGSVPGTPEIEHVEVTNVTAARASQDYAAFQPCAVLALGPLAGSDSIQIKGTPYRPSWTALDPVAPLEQVAVLTVDGH